MDECQSGSHSCHAQAQCVNIQGSYECRCLSGYLGDGRATCAGNFEIKHARTHHTTVFCSRRHRLEIMSFDSLSSIDAPLLMITSKTWTESASRSNWWGGISYISCQKAFNESIWILLSHLQIRDAWVRGDKERKNINNNKTNTNHQQNKKQSNKITTKLQKRYWQLKIKKRNKPRHNSFENEGTRAVFVYGKSNLAI